MILIFKKDTGHTFIVVFYFTEIALNKILKTLAFTLLLSVVPCKADDVVKVQEITTAQNEAKEATAEKRADLMKAAYDALGKVKAQDSKLLVFYKDGEKYIDHTGNAIPNADAVVDTKGTKTSTVLDELSSKATESGTVVEYKKKDEQDPTKDIEKEGIAYSVVGKDGASLYTIVVIKNKKENVEAKEAVVKQATVTPADAQPIENHESKATPETATVPTPPAATDHTTVTAETPKAETPVEKTPVAADPLATTPSADNAKTTETSKDSTVATVNPISATAK